MTCYSREVYARWNRMRIRKIVHVIAYDWASRLYCDGNDFMWKISVSVLTNPKKASETMITWENFVRQELPKE